MGWGWCYVWVGGYERDDVGWIVRGEGFVRWAWYRGYVGGTCCEVGFKPGGGGGTGRFALGGVYGGGGWYCVCVGS